LRLGMTDVAYSDLRQCLQLKPDHDVASSLLQQFNTGKKLVFTGRNFVKS
jgi:hypothetical protein